MAAKQVEPALSLSTGNDDDSLEEEHGIRANYVTERFTYYYRCSTTNDAATSGDDLDFPSCGVVNRQHPASHRPLGVVVCSATTTTGGQLTSQNHDATGILIWPATHLLCQEIVGASHVLSASDRPLAVVELGCGVGLVGVTAVHARPASIALWVSTDMDERSLKLCRGNFRLNGTHTDEPNSRAWVRPLPWGDSMRIQGLLRDVRDRTGKDRFDEAFGADIVYPSTPDLVLSQLLSTVDALLRPGGTFWLSFATRDGSKTPLRLIEAASRAGFIVDSLDPIDGATRRLLPPLLDSKVLSLRRDQQARTRNQELGKDSCRVFPGLQAQVKKLEDDSSEEEWEAPFTDGDE
jgi:SAM-dependent methyltransferase